MISEIKDSHYSKCAQKGSQRSSVYLIQWLIQAITAFSLMKATVWLLLSVLLLMSFETQAGYLVNLSFNNQKTDASLTLTFDSEVKPKLSLDPSPMRLLVDLNAKNGIQGLPVAFSGLNLMKGIETEKAKEGQTRLSVLLSQDSHVSHTLKKQGGKYVLTIQLKALGGSPQSQTAQSAAPTTAKKDLNEFINQPRTSTANKNGNDKTPANTTPEPSKTKQSAVLTPKKQNHSGKIVIAIDAGHGGKDPGAVGSSGHKEKTIAFAVSQKLEKLLKADPMFAPVLTRTGDYYISVPDRSEIARKQKANLLVSIHADAAPNKDARGASVWVLSNKRANNEMAGWLEKQEKQSELLGGAGDVLSGNTKDKYLSQAVIDLQFGHSQKVGYGAAQEVIKDLGKIGKLHKKKPEHASLGVLRSPDIPSLLVEIGFISNKAEEHLLATPAYQDKLAQSIYKGLKRYFNDHPVNTSASEAIVSTSKGQTQGSRKHKVKKGDSLSEIAEKYRVSASAIKKANNMKDNNVILGQTLTIPE